MRLLPQKERARSSRYLALISKTQVMGDQGKNEGRDKDFRKSRVLQERQRSVLCSRPLHVRACTHYALPLKGGSEPGGGRRQQGLGQGTHQPHKWGHFTDCGGEHSEAMPIALAKGIPLVAANTWFTGYHASRMPFSTWPFKTRGNFPGHLWVHRSP